MYPIYFSIETFLYTYFFSLHIIIQNVPIFLAIRALCLKKRSLNVVYQLTRVGAI